MKFADFVCRESVSTELTSFDKESVVREMVKTLLEGGHIAAGEFESIVEAILKREELGSTGIGRGVAVPHTKHPSVDQAGRHRGGERRRGRLRQPRRREGALVLPADFAARSAGRPPAGAWRTSRGSFRDDTFCRFLKQAKTADDVLTLLDEADQNQFVH